MARGYHHLVINVVLDGNATESGFIPAGQICLWHWEDLMQYLESRRSKTVPRVWFATYETQSVGRVKCASPDRLGSEEGIIPKVLHGEALYTCR